MGKPHRVKVKPATPLPWLCDPTGDCGPDWIGVDGHFVFEGTERLQDATYTTHAANAYPKLVAAVKEIADGRELPMHEARALLRELGEDN